MTNTRPLKKCIVLDLDNTLWGGIIGEDGQDGIALSLKPPGNSFMAFQQALRDYYDRGIILAINSRNNEDEAMEVIRTHPNMILKENHFAARRINWKDKVENLKELAEELNISLDSMVFLDDDPVNRQLVQTLLPEVLTPELPENPEEYVAFLNSLAYFDSNIITNEDLMRGNFYVTERLRREEERNFTNKEDFLRNLNLELIIYEDSSSHLERLSQLTEKTNQFNTLKKPLSTEEISQYIKSPQHTVFYAKLRDKFGDHGIIAFALAKRDENSWNIESFLMSCRVFGRNVENAFLGEIIGRGIVQGIKKISIAFEETPKNAPAKEFVTEHFNQGEHNMNKKPYIPPWIKTEHEV